MKNAFSCVLAILWPFLNAFSQPPVGHPLTVGDAVPDFLIRNIVNYKTPSARLSDFKDQLLILDFMASTCGSCMYNLFRMDTLEKSYIGKLQVLPVSYEPKAKLVSVLQKEYAGKKINAPFATQDAVFKSWFPHQFVSHMVWIHKGIVKAITRPEYVNAANIDAVLRNEEIHLPVKRDLGRYDPALPLFSPNPEAVTATNFSALKFYASVPGFIDGLASSAGIYRDTVHALQRRYVMNESIIRLYLLAFGQTYDFPHSRILLHVADTSRFIFNHKGYSLPWKMKNLYCYEASFPLTATPEAIQSKMQADLNFSLGMNGRMEKQKRRFLFIRKIPGMETVSAPPSDKIIDISGLIIRLNEVYGGVPAFTAIPPRERLYVEMPPSMQDIPAIQQILLQHGMEAIEMEQELDVLVLTEKSTLP